MNHSTFLPDNAQIESHAPLETEAPAIPRPNERAPLKLRLVTLTAVTLPLLGVLAAAISLWGVAFNWIYLAVMVVMYLISGLGITIGFHRLFTHKSFDTYKPISYMWGAFGSMAVQGPLSQWAAMHRKHHQHSDSHDDPHSPNTHGDSVLGTLRGLWHAHWGWLFDASPKDLPRYIPDLTRDRVATSVSRLFPLWAFLGLLVPAAVAGLATMSWTGALLGLIWGGLVRVFLVQHVTWSVNSVCHVWGARPYESHDESRNNPIFGVLALGEGWHNNHHAFPASARHGLAWWQFDISYIIIRTMAFFRLAWNVRVPSPERMMLKRRA